MCDYKIPTIDQQSDFNNRGIDRSLRFDPINQNINKGGNPQTVAALSHRRSEASVSMRNAGIQTCADGTSCAYAGANSNKIEQMLSNQQLYDSEGIPRGQVTLNRRGTARAHDYHAGRSVGNERNQRLYRASTDARHCASYCCKDAILQPDGTINNTAASKELAPAIYANSKFVRNAGPSWVDGTSELREKADKASRETEMDALDYDQYDRPGTGYDDFDDRT